MYSNKTDSEILPGGVVSVLSGIPGSMISDAQGCRLRDTAGREYIDFIGGYGPIILGHCDSFVVDAVYRQMKRCDLVAAYSPLYDKLNDVVRQFFPHTDRCLFLKTGSEAVLAAIRLARTFTGRRRVIRCGFHGWHDGFISPCNPWHFLGKEDGDKSTGRIIDGCIPDENVIAWDGYDTGVFKELFIRYPGEIAACILDPIQLTAPFKEKLEKIKSVCEESGALLILDELKTGFRVTMGGVQEMYGITADITILGKAMANGFPLAVVASRNEIISVSRQTRIMGTYNGELMSIAAALATITRMQQLGTIQRIEKTGKTFIDLLNREIKLARLEFIVAAVPYRWFCMPFLHFNNQLKLVRDRQTDFYRKLVERGVLMLSGHPNFISHSHREDDMDVARDTIIATLKDTFLHYEK